jgi:hypothetical protein
MGLYRVLTDNAGVKVCLLSTPLFE